MPVAMACLRLCWYLVVSIVVAVAVAVAIKDVRSIQSSPVHRPLPAFASAGYDWLSVDDGKGRPMKVGIFL